MRHINSLDRINGGASKSDQSANEIVCVIAQHTKWYIIPKKISLLFRCICCRLTGKLGLLQREKLVKMVLETYRWHEQSSRTTRWIGNDTIKLEWLVLARTWNWGKAVNHWVMIVEFPRNTHEYPQSVRSIAVEVVNHESMSSVMVQERF